MSRSSSPRPTDGELAILHVLWTHGPSAVRDVHEQLGRRSAGYTTVLKLLQIMLKKGLVKRDDSQRRHVYAAAAPREQTQRSLLRDLLDRAFDGSAARLMMGALSAKPASTEELAAIRRLLDEHERKST